jgi:hypothetical protein
MVSETGNFLSRTIAGCPEGSGSFWVVRVQRRGLERIWSETAVRLKKLFAYVVTRKCVTFLNEFEKLR